LGQCRYNGTAWVNVGQAGFSTAGAHYTSLAFNSSGEPYVAYQDHGNSEKATVMRFTTSVGISPLSVGEEVGLRLYPNPASSIFNIQTNEPLIAINIYNTLGALAQTETRNSFSIEYLPVGVYMVHVKTQNGTSVQKVVKE